MNILIVTAGLTRESGGVFYAVRDLAKAMQKFGHTVAVAGITPPNYHHLEDLETWGTIPLLTAPAHGPSKLSWSPGLAKISVPFKPDIIHVHGIWSHPLAVGYRLSRRYSCPLVISPHGMLDPWILSRGRLQKWLAQRWFVNKAIRHASAIHALNEQERRDILTVYPRTPVFIAPNGTNIPCHHRFPSPWPISFAGKRVVLFLGRLHDKKGLRPLMLAFENLIAHHADTASRIALALAGFGDAGLTAEIIDWTNQPHISKSATFLGPIFNEQKYAALGNATAFILPSFGEGLPMAVLEAWSFGLPCILTDGCNLPEAFEHALAWRCTTEPESISEALRSLASADENHIVDMGIRAKQFVREGYSWEMVTKKLTEFYKTICTSAHR